MKRLSTFAIGTMGPFWVSAHEGHGMPSPSHWHAGDALGFVMAIAVVAALIWWGGRGR